MSLNIVLEKIKHNKYQIIQIVGAVLIAISPFFSWEVLEIEGAGQDTITKNSLKDLALWDSELGTHFGWLVKGMLAIGVILAFIHILKCFFPRVLQKFDNKAIKYVFITLVALAVVFLLVAYNSKTIKNDVKWYAELINNYKMVYSDVKGNGGRGVGPVLCLVGILSQIPEVIKIFINVKTK